MRSSGLKVEAILDTPLNIVVTVDHTRGGRHTLGRHAQPQTAAYSAALAVENLWLAARAEGLGVGWVSFFSERELARELGLPPHLEIVAYLCVGYVEEFPQSPNCPWAAGRSAARWPGQCTGSSTANAACQGRSPPACWTRQSRKSVRSTRGRWRRHENASPA